MRAAVTPYPRLKACTLLPAQEPEIYLSLALQREAIRDLLVAIVLFALKLLVAYMTPPSLSE